MLRILTSVVVLLTALAGATAFLYTAEAFSWLGLHTVALDVVDARIGSAGLVRFEIDGLRFTPGEITHLFDVKALVVPIRWSLPPLLLILGVIAWRRPHLAASGAGLSFAFYAAMVALVAVGYGLRGHIGTSNLLHDIFFAPGTYIFSKGTLMAKLYSHADIEGGALFVITVTGGLAVLIWLVARLIKPEV